MQPSFPTVVRILNQAVKYEGIIEQGLIVFNQDESYTGSTASQPSGSWRAARIAQHNP
jgi:hypothetical protein